VIITIASQIKSRESGFSPYTYESKTRWISMAFVWPVRVDVHTSPAQVAATTRVHHLRDLREDELCLA
jgi:hypothetical protein